MVSKIMVFLVTFFHIFVSSFSDSDPGHDFCIPRTKVSPTSCKNSSLATVQDFVYSGIRNAGDIRKTGFAATLVSSTAFPGLNTLGMSFVRADFSAGGINVPHYHPRATEIAYVLKGKIYSGFVDSQNRVFAKVLQKGDVMVYPRGLVHFQMNTGNSPATILGSFNSQNPGLVKIPDAIFGSKIKESLLLKAFGLTAKEMAKLRKQFKTRS